MKALFYLLPIMAGIAITIQSGINSQLRIAIQHPFMASFISFLGGTIALGVILLMSRTYPSIDSYSTISWYKFTGGLFGVFVVTVTLLSVTEVGASNMFVLIIAGQLVASVLMDHFGMLGLKTNPITLQKFVGILFLVLGAYIVNRK